MSLELNGKFSRNELKTLTVKDVRFLHLAYLILRLLLKKCINVFMFNTCTRMDTPLNSDDNLIAGGIQ
jgi:hypothetical protein